MIRDPKKFKEYKMPWGKYRDKALHHIPSSYLYWLAKDCDDDNIATFADEDATFADEEWQWREKYNEHIGKRK